MLNKEEMLAVLRRDVIPALGCTEPVTVALAAADAAKALGGAPTSITMEVNPNIYKNGMSVGIPRFSRVGLEYAAALGALIADPSLELQVFSGITPEIEQKAIEMVEAKCVSVTIDREQTKIYACAEITGENLPIGEAVIRGAEMPFEGALYAFTAAYEYSGKAEEFIEAVTVSLPVAIEGEFRLLRADEAQTEIPFTMEEGVLTFETETAGLFIIVPAAEEA